MGSVKVDLHGKERFYKDLTFSDIDVVRLLIEYRHKYDKYFGNETNNFFHEAGQVADVNQEAIATYADLDVLIQKCKLNDEQFKILEMIWDGYSYIEVADALGMADVTNINKRIKTICKKIVSQNNRQWRMKFYTNRLALVSKRCSKCKEELPATDEFFHYDSKNEKYKSACIFCRN